MGQIIWEINAVPGYAELHRCDTIIQTDEGRQSEASMTKKCARCGGEVSDSELFARVSAQKFKFVLSHTVCSDCIAQIMGEWYIRHQELDKYMAGEQEF